MSKNRTLADFISTSSVSAEEIANGAVTVVKLANTTSSNGTSLIQMSGHSTALNITPSGRIGIDTNDPNQKLHVHDSSTNATHIRTTNSNGDIFYGLDGNGAGYAWMNSGAGNFYIGTNGAGDLIAYAGSAERMRINSSGNVGIGTTSPSQLLHINSAGNVAAALIQGASHTAKISTDGAGTIFGATTNGYMLLTTNSAERMRIHSGGQVSIASTEATHGLNVGQSGTDFRGRFQGNNPYRLGLQNGTNNLVWLGSPGADAFRISNAAGSAVFDITSAGYVGIGTTNPQAELEVTGGGGAGIYVTSAGTTNGGVIRMRNTTSSDYIWRMAVGGGDNAYVAGRGFFIRDDTAGATRLSINENGGVGIGTTSAYPEKLHVAASNAGSAFKVHGTTGNIEAYSQGASGNVTNLQTTAKHVLLQSYMDNGGRKWYQGLQLMLNNAHYASGTPHCRLILNTSQGGYNNGAMIHVEGAGSYNAGQLVFSTGWDATEYPIERMRIKGDEFRYNGLKIFAKNFYGVNNQSYTFDIPVGDEGGGGQNILVLATHAHYYNFAYGCGYYAILGRRQASPGTQARVIDSWSNANGGSWSISNPSNNTMRLTKSAGTYGGGGYGMIYVIYPLGT